MAKKTKVEIDLFSPASVEKALGSVSLYARQFDRKVDLFVQKLAEKGVQIAKDKIRSYDAIFTGELLNNLRAEKRGDCYFIISDTEHTAYVEFGTGQLGLVRPYKHFDKIKPSVTWNYASGSQVQISDEPLLWGDYEIPANTYFWFYWGDDQRWHLTQGLPSRPFMYETAQTLQQKKVIREVAKEVFGND